MLWERSITARELALNLYSPFDCLDRTGKLGQQRVAWRVDYAAIVCGDMLREDLSICRERRNGSLLVVSHQARIANYVGA